MTLKRAPRSFAKEESKRRCKQMHADARRIVTG